MKYHSRKLRLMVSAWTALFTHSLTLAAPPTAQSPGSQPAAWVAHDISLNLYHLPRGYSCDDLQQKFRDVLLALGASQDASVLTSRCEPGSRSPRVRLRFSLPEILASTAKQSTVIKASTTLVRLEAGHPGSLDATDCELLRQIKDGLLAPISQQVTTFNLACSAPASKGAHFNLTVRTLQPLMAVAQATPPGGQTAGK